MRLNAFSFLAMLIVASTLIASSPIQALTAQWPMEGHDLSRRGLSPYVPANEGPGVIWKAGLGVDWGSELLIDEDGTVYAVAGGTIFAFDENGKMLWSNQTSRWPNIQSAELTVEGNILVNGGGSIFILDHENGQGLWRYQTSAGQYIEWTACLEDGSILIEFYNDFAPSFGYQVAKLSPQRTLDWTLNMNRSYSLPASVSSNGTIFLASHSKLCAVDQNGSLLWNRTVQGYSITDSSPLLAEDGTIYVHSDPKLFAFSPNGTMKWEVFLPLDKEGAWSMDRNGNIVIGLRAGDAYYPLNHTTQPEGPSLMCISPQGSVLWRRWLPDGSGAGCSCTPNGLIYLATWNFLLVLDENGTLLWQRAFHEISTSPVISADGTVYFMTYYDKSDILVVNTKLYAIRGEVGPDLLAFELIVLGPVIILLALIIRWVVKSKDKGSGPTPLIDNKR